MLKVSIAALTAALFAVGLVASGALAASTSDSRTSSDNSKLTCKLDITVQNGQAIVTWTITGATKVSIDPLTFKNGIPLKGSQTLATGQLIHVFLVAQDGQGHAVHCTANEGKYATTGGGGATGTGGDGNASTSSKASGN